MDLPRFWSIRPAKPHAAFSHNGFVPLTELLYTAEDGLLAAVTRKLRQIAKGAILWPRANLMPASPPWRRRYPRLKERLERGDKTSKHWVDTVYGAFANDPDFLEAMRLGRKYRESLRPRLA